MNASENLAQSLLTTTLKTMRLRQLDNGGVFVRVSLYYAVLRNWRLATCTVGYTASTASSAGPSRTTGSSDSRTCTSPHVNACVYLQERGETQRTSKLLAQTPARDYPTCQTTKHKHERLNRTHCARFLRKLLKATRIDSGGNCASPRPSPSSIFASPGAKSVAARWRVAVIT